MYLTFRKISKVDALKGLKNVSVAIVIFIFMQYLFFHISFKPGFSYLVFSSGWNQVTDSKPQTLKIRFLDLYEIIEGVSGERKA